MTAPTKKVNTKVTNLTLKRDGSSIEAKWKIPSAMKKDSDKHHAEFVVCELDFNVPKGKKAGSVYYGSASHSKGMSYDGYDDVKIRNLGMSTSVTKSFDRSRFHPVEKGRTVTEIDASVWGCNTPGEWKSDSTGYWWKRYDGSYPKNSWEYIDGQWYYFRANGYMATGTVSWDGKNYTLASDGHLASSSVSGTWEKTDGKSWFKYSGGGYAKNCWEYISGQWYLFDKSGWMLTGTVTKNGKDYKFASDGHYIPPSGEIAGPAVHALFKISKPKAPTVSLSYDQSNARVTATVESEDGKNTVERYDTMVKIELTNTTVKNNKTVSTKSTLLKWSSVKSAKWSKVYDISGYLKDLKEGDYVEVVGYAYARGLAGDNPAASKPVKSNVLVVGIPNKATIGSITVDKKNETGVVKVAVTPGARTGTMQLERRHGESGSWETVDGATDNSNGRALYDSWGNVWPNGVTKGEKIWYRVKSMRHNFTIYSEYKEAACLYEAPPKETCSATNRIMYYSFNQAGTAVLITMGWKPDSNTGSELSWSEYAGGWNSTDAPNVQLLPDSGTGAVAPLQNKVPGWLIKRHWITGLTPGQGYYVRTRRYKTYASGNTVYSAYDKEDQATLVKPDDASDDACGIVAVTVDGTVAELVIGINENNENTGTEVTWADNEQAWRSNQQPESFNATWARSAYDYDESDDWDYQQTVYLRGLEAGRTYYVKARRYLEAQAGTTYTPYSNTQSVTIPSGASASNYDVRCGLVSVNPGEDGKSAEVVIGWDGDRTGCEASWSDNPDAWTSSDGPSDFEYEWEDKWNRSGFKTSDVSIVTGKTYYTRTGSGTDASPYRYTKVSSPSAASLSTYYELAWSHTATCYISGLEEGTTYYVRARSYFDGDPKAYSDYSTDLSVTPYSAPESVTLEAPVAIARGDAIECWWDIASEQPQTEWHIHLEDSPNAALMQGAGSLCHATIDPDRYGDADSVAFYVSAGCGGGLTRSNLAVVRIASAPSCEASCDSVLTAQPAEFEVITDDDSARLLATVYSEGCTLEAPDGGKDQLDGDSVWTSVITPSWQASRWDATGLYSQLSTAASTAASALSDAQDAFDATDEATALSSAESSMESAKETLDALTPEDAGYDAALTAYQAAFSAYSAAYDAAYATSEGIALQNANASSESATEALEAHDAADTVYTTTVTMPASDLYDGGTYRAEFRTVESVAGLASETAEAEFSVAYSHQAPDPAGTTYVSTEDTEIDPSKRYYAYENSEYVEVENPVAADLEDYFEVRGVRILLDPDERSATIVLAPPSDSVSTDVFDIYRQTPSGYELIAKGLAMDAVVQDLYAPFGKAETAYRVCARTADGDISWAEFPYSMPIGVLRFDWGMQHAEFPWNIEIRENAKKDYEERVHADGSVNGYWDRGVSFSGSYATDIVKVQDSDLLRLARQVGSHPGAVWVRDGYGKAMQCNVELSESSISYKSKAVGLSFSFSAMKTTSQFMPADKEVANG